MSVAASEVPSSGATGDSEDRIGAVTSVVSDARAIGKTTRFACDRGTVTASKPASATRIDEPVWSSENSKPPSGPDTTSAVTVAPSISSTIAPGSGNPV